ncbi:MAG: hypothetical protein HY289_06010 [Planctomycetes bacterium]|nr:hypothetical protein [Planctomycetota bacterium]
MFRLVTAVLIGLNTSFQPVPPPVAPQAVDDKMFPDGLAHDFGTVQCGAQLYHAFRIVNTSDVPMKIASVRRSP